MRIRQTSNSRFTAALLDYKQPFPTVHLSGRKQMWELARAGHEGASAKALLLLAADPTLTAGEACQLERLTREVQGPERYAVLSAWIKTSPSQREAVLDAEEALVSAVRPDEKTRFRAWLASLKEYERLLRFLPRETEVKSAALGPELLRLKLEALAGTNRWEDVKRLLVPAVEKKLGGVASNLWHSRLAAQQLGKQTLVRRHLELALKSFKGEDGGLHEILQGAALSEEQDCWDIAAEFYQRAALHSPDQRTRLAMMEKSMVAYSKLRNTSALLQMAADIARMTPGNDLNAFRADYLALLAGQSLEVIAARVTETQAEPGSESEGRLLLLKSMSAYRLRQPLPSHTALRALRTTGWPPGQRAVLAAMVATGGDASAAFKIAERVPGSLLLPEETQMLALAK